MKIIKSLVVFVGLSLWLSACDKSEDIDAEKPVIDFSVDNVFPQICDTIYFGESFVLKMRFTDNVALSSYSVDIHHNFDHHTHSYDIDECNLSTLKSAQNPFVFLRDYSILGGTSQYITDIFIEIPGQNDSGNYDEGDYHFHLNLVDSKGWSTPYGMSVKILYR